MKKFLTFVFLLAFALDGLAQSNDEKKNKDGEKPSIKFFEFTYDFGTIREEEGKVSHVFEFENDGNVDLILSNVRASCGCTTPQWSREPIAPGEKGSIKVQYNAAGRPGPFTKSITITSNAPRKTLIIKGNVTPKGKKLEEIYSIVKGDIRFKTENVNLGPTTFGEKKVAKLPLANVGLNPVKIEFLKLPKHVTLKNPNIEIAPKTTTQIEFVYDTKLKNDWGTIAEDLEFVTIVNEKRSTKQSFRVILSVYEKFTKEQKEKAPVLDVLGVVDFGELKIGKKKTIKLDIANKGLSQLIFHKASFKDNPKGVSVKTPSKLNVGKSSKMKIVIDAKALSEQSFNRTIVLITNDPLSPQKTINVRGKIVK